MEENQILEDQMIVLVDEDGTEVSFEMVASLEIDGQKYALLAENEESDDVIPFRIVEDEENEEMTLMPVEDDEEFEKIGLAYDALFDDEDECDCGCEHHHHEG